MTRSHALALVAAFAVAAVAPASAADVFDAGKSLSGTRVSFTMPAGYFNATLSVAGPDGRVLQTSAKSGAASIDIGGQNAMGDGTYTYQITAATPETKMIKPDEADGRALPTRTNMRGEMAIQVGASASGTFVVKGGRIVDTSNVKEPAR
jgi:hypothetical protein